MNSGAEKGCPFDGKKISDVEDCASIYSYNSDRTETSNRLPRKFSLEKNDRDDFQKFKKPEVQKEPEVFRKRPIRSQKIVEIFPSFRKGRQRFRTPKDAPEPTDQELELDDEYQGLINECSSKN